MKTKKMVCGVIIACTLLLASGCRNQVESVSDYRLCDENAYQLPDGNTVSSWYDCDNRRLIYRLGNGDELLAVSEKMETESICEDFGVLNTDAKKQIVDFYRQQAPIYDIADYLLLAYEEYSSISEDTPFETYFIDQETVLSSSNENIVYFTTTIMLPIKQGEYGEYKQTHAFERMTGAAINGWSLFSVAEDKVKAAFFNKCSSDARFIDALYTAFRPEYLCLYDDGYEVSIPYDKIENYYAENDIYSVFVIWGEYTDEILSVLNWWAIPDNVH